MWLKGYAPSWGSLGVGEDRSTGVREGFKAYLEESKENGDFILFSEPEYFDTEAEALAFCGGIGYGSDERALPERFPLRSCEETDIPFIEAIDNY